MITTGSSAGMQTPKQRENQDSGMVIYEMCDILKRK